MAVEHDEEAPKECWYHNVDGDIKDLYEAGYNESSIAERKGPPGYSKLETRRFNQLDWRAEAIVSSFLNTLYLYSTRPLPSPSLLHAGSLSAHSHHCVDSILIVLRHSFPSQGALIISFIPFLQHSLPGNLPHT